MSIIDQLKRYRDNDPNIDVARVYRDPSIDSHGDCAAEFEIWIVFEFDGFKLVQAEVVKSPEIDRLFDRIELKALDVLFAKAATTDLDFHKAESERHFRFNDYKTGVTFLVDKIELLGFLDRQFEALKVERKNRGNNVPRDQTGNTKACSPRDLSTPLLEEADDLMGIIDSLTALGQ